MRPIQHGLSVGCLSAVLAVILAAWFLAVLTAGAVGVFESAPSRPPLLLLVAVAISLLQLRQMAGRSAYADA